jgi:uncharacterized protein
MGKIQIGSAIAEQGERANGYLEIASTLDGSSVKTPVIILHGSKPGPRLWVQGCIHGNEYCGAVGILQVCREVNPREMAGTLIAFPALNITGFLEERRFSPHTLFGVPDLNRVFPGKPNGNFNEIAAYHIFKCFIENADYHIDLHCGNSSDTFWTLYNEDGSETAKKSCEIAKAFGIELIYPSTAEMLKNGMFTQATQHHIPSIIIEAGGWGELFTQEAADTASEGVKRVMRYLKILDQPFSWKEHYVLFKDWTWMWATHGGHFVPSVKVRDTIKTGQIIARVYTIFNEELEPVKSPVNGIVLTITKKPFVTAGDSIIQIGIP